ncbi:YidH family protein [Sphingomonas cavernae]|uniref:DUF202 domain-containing protein n=1 Tax=Sphingomonas cavernae TaxID=2320861 RepID=A0A418WM79_9SPHN|nr:DUF202 domain-containing protein [Sphingomonas cavernae]RJF91112.1 DUF202 domain-containing protein [Sphingomonas cavernae]
MTSPRPQRPEKVVETPLPDLPSVANLPAEEASTTYSHYRTGLSHHRTELSEHRTDLSEYRTDLSTYRTDLSGDRTELSMRRTGMSIQRTRMSADRTLMSVIRTALSLIGFGFTINQAFAKLVEAGTFRSAEAPRNFGIALIIVGILVMVGGIWRHIQFATELRNSRAELTEEGLIHGQSRYPVSVTLIASIALALIGMAAILSIAFGAMS